MRTFRSVPGRLGLSLCVLGASVFLAPAPLVSAQTAQALATKAMPPQAGFYRMKVGDFTVTAISEGTLPLKLNDLLTHVKPGQIGRSLALSNLNDPAQTSVNTFLIDTGSRLILVDTGAGDLFGLTVGALAACKTPECGPNRSATCF